MPEPLLGLSGKRVWVAGHRGLVGSALVRRLKSEDVDLLTVERKELDLRDQQAVDAWRKGARPAIVFLAAAKVGGIGANGMYPADFLYDSLMIEANVLHAAFENRVEKLLLLGSTCIYPKFAAQPIGEDALLSGPLEPTNEFYSVAKIAGIKLAQAYRRQHGCDFIVAQPCNLYGPGADFDLETSHVLPALLRKAHEAKVGGAPAMTVWGSGRPLREFLHVDDLAEALVFLMRHYSGEEPVNVGSGEEVSIRELAQTIAEVVGFGGALRFDLLRPDGVPRKLADVSRLRSMGWKHSTGLRDGLRDTYAWFLENVAAEACCAR